MTITDTAPHTTSPVSERERLVTAARGLGPLLRENAARA